MTTKADIAKKISKDLNLSYETSSGIVNAFISIVNFKNLKLALLKLVTLEHLKLISLSKDLAGTQKRKNHI